MRWAAGASNRRTSLFVMCGSSARGRGGMKSTAIRCWHSDVPSITVHWSRCLDSTNSGFGNRQNDRMLPDEQRSFARRFMMLRIIRLFNAFHDAHKVDEIAAAIMQQWIAFTVTKAMES